MLHPTMRVGSVVLVNGDIVCGLGVIYSAPNDKDYDRILADDKDVHVWGVNFLVGFDPRNGEYRPSMGYNLQDWQRGTLIYVAESLWHMDESGIVHEKFGLRFGQQ